MAADAEERPGAMKEMGFSADETSPIPPTVPEEHSDPDSTSAQKEVNVEGSDTSQGGEKEDVAEQKKEEVVKPFEEERSRAKIALIMLSLCMAVFLSALDVTIITTALPTISSELHSSAGYTWIGSAFLLANSASTPLWGKFSDIFGRKPVLLVANAVFFIGSLLAAVSVDIGMLIFARAVQGIGGGGLIVLVNICIGDLFSQRRRGAYYGMIGGVWALASSLGPILGGVFTEKVSWRWCFYINLPIDGAAFLIILFLLDIKTPKTPLWAGLKAIDWLGSLLVVGGTLMFLFGLEYGGETFPWDSATVICLIVFGIFTAGLFIIVEWKVAKYPVIPLRLFKYRSNIAALVVCFCHGFCFIAGSYYLPLYFQAALGKSPIMSGVYILAQSGAISVASIGTGVFIRKTGKYMPPILFGLCFMTVGTGLYIDLDRTSSLTKIMVYQVIAGLGAGPNFQAPLIALQTLVAPRDIASAVATFGFIRNLSTAISVVIGNVVYQNIMSTKTSQLAAELGAATAERVSGGNAGANVGIIKALPAMQRLEVQTAIADSLSRIWILYCVVAGIGLLSAFLITRQVLQKTHEETQTGLEAEEKNRLEAKAGRDLKQLAKQNASAEAEARRKEMGGSKADV